MINEFLIDLGRASFTWVWLPTLIWTALAVSVLAMLRLARGLHPLLGYRLRQALPFALPATVLLTPLMPSGLYPMSLSMSPMRALPLLGEATAPPTLPGSPDLLGLWAGVVTLAVLFLAMGHAVNLLRHLVALARLRSASAAVEGRVPLELLGELTERLGVRRAVILREGPADCVPLTFHTFEPSIVVPRSMLHDHSVLRIALAHELVHVRRGDYAWAVAERVVAAAFAFHPLIWGLRRSVEHFRESSCDAEIVASGITNTRAYAELLYDLSGRAPLRLGVAASIATRTSNLRQRLETMKHFTENPTSGPPRRRSSVGALSLLLGIALLGACAGQEREPDPEDYDIGVAFPPQFGDMTAEAREVALERLEVQLDYLVNEIEGIKAERTAMLLLRQAEGIELDQSFTDLGTRRQLLGGFYRERLSTLELLRMEVATDRQLGN